LFQFTKTEYKALARYKQTKNTGKAGSSDPISVTYLPTSVFFAVAHGKFVHFFEEKPAAKLTTVGPEVYFLELKETIFAIKDSYYYTDLIIVSQTKVFNGFLVLDDTIRHVVVLLPTVAIFF